MTPSFLTQVFARTTPDQKGRLVQAYARLGLTTCMCGDGTNDVAALKVKGLICQLPGKGCCCSQGRGRMAGLKVEECLGEGRAALWGCWCWREASVSACHNADKYYALPPR